MNSAPQKLFFSLLFSLSLIGCADSKHSGKPVTKRFTEATAKAQSANATAYDIELRGQNFSSLPTRNGNFMGLPSTQLSKTITNIKWENAQLEVRLGPNKKLQYEIDFLRGLRINQLDESGRYSVVGACLDRDCSQAQFLLEDTTAGEQAEVLYTRSYEYLTQSNTSELVGLDKELIAEAIEYKFPVARHSARINNSRDLDLLIIERPLVDKVQEDFSEAKIVMDDGRPFIEKRSARSEKRRVELSTSGSVRVQTKSQAENPTKKLRLTPNPYEAYNISLPANFFGSGETVKNTNQLSSHFAIVPIEQQKAMEPPQRIAAIAKAFVEQGVKIYRNACNIYVRSVLSLAGYTHGGHNLVSNEFHKLFEENQQGLQDWEERIYRLNDSSLNQLSKDLSNAISDHGFVAQVDRSHLGLYGHTGVLVVEGQHLVIYDSSLDERGPRRTVVNAKKLLNSRRPVLKLHSYPLLIKSLQ